MTGSGSQGLVVGRDLGASGGKFTPGRVPSHIGTCGTGRRLGLQRYREAKVSIKVSTGPPLRCRKPTGICLGAENRATGRGSGGLSEGARGPHPSPSRNRLPRSCLVSLSCKWETPDLTSRLTGRVSGICAVSTKSAGGHQEMPFLLENRSLVDTLLCPSAAQTCGPLHPSP